MEILCYGSLNIDYTYHVPHTALPGETLSSKSLDKNAGGKGENQAAALGRAGCNVKMAGKIGKDGIFLLEELRKSNVNTDNVIISDGITGHAIIQLSDSGENSIILYPGANREQQECDIDRVFSKAEGGSYLVIQNEISNLRYIINAAKEKRMRIVFNPAPFDETVRELPLDEIDILIVNEIEAAGLAGMNPSAEYGDILKKLSEDYPKAQIIMTAGSNGAYYINGSNRYYQPIIETAVADTTAAGDTFIGYFIASEIRGCSIEKSMYYAAKASSIAVSREGAMKSIPYENEVFDD